MFEELFLERWSHADHFHSITFESCKSTSLTKHINIIYFPCRGVYFFAYNVVDFLAFIFIPLSILFAIRPMINKTKRERREGRQKWEEKLKYIKQYMGGVSVANEQEEWMKSFNLENVSIWWCTLRTTKTKQKRMMIACL